MTPAEAAALLAVAAAFDNRRADESTALAWAAALNGLRFDDCRTAIVEHYTNSTEWLMPASIRAAVRRLRDKRLAEHPPLIPPPGLDDTAEREWIAAARRRVGDGETVDTSDLYDPLPEAPARLRAMIAAAEQATAGGPR